MLSSSEKRAGFTFTHTIGMFISKVVWIYSYYLAGGWHEFMNIAGTHTITLSPWSDFVLYEKYHTRTCNTVSFSSQYFMLGFAKRQRNRFEKVVDSNICLIFIICKLQWFSKKSRTQQVLAKIIIPVPRFWITISISPPEIFEFGALANAKRIHTLSGDHTFSLALTGVMFDYIFPPLGAVFISASSQGAKNKISPSIMSH